MSTLEMFNKSLSNAGHTRRYSIVSTESGWEVREEEDNRVVRRVAYHDWHRVERARRSIAHQLNALQEAGWVLE